jgi:hypothetical protein
MAIPLELRLQTAETNNEKRLLRPILAGKAGFATRTGHFYQKRVLVKSRNHMNVLLNLTLPPPNHNDRRICAF